MKAFVRAVMLVCVTLGATHAADCPPDSIPAAQWQKFRAHDFAVGDEAQLQAYALALLPCLDDPDPKIRDGLAIDALTSWLRGKQVSAATARQLMTRLIARLSEPDENGFGRPFAALALAEVARMDRIDPYLTSDEYATLVDAASGYLKNVRDYRGFDEHDGWRHGVAHGADWLMQLALNPRTGKPQLDAMLEAIATQSVPLVAHFYIYGESGRLARPVVFIAQRQLHSTEEWRTWLAKTALPADAGSTLGLATHHNRTSFLSALHVMLHQNQDAPWRAAILEPVSQALRN